MAATLAEHAVVIYALMISATELVNFTRCRHLTVLRRNKVKPSNQDDDNLYAKKGNEHETKFLGGLRACFSVSREGNESLRHETTLRAMRDGHDWIYHGYLIDDHAKGEVDFLRKVPVRSSLGGFSYEVWDTKLSKTPRAEHVLQLCHYSELLSRAQGRAPEYAGVIAGDFAEHRFRLEDFIYYYRNLLGSYSRFLETPTETAPYPIAYCDRCAYLDHCAGELRSQNHVALTQGIKRTQVAALAKLGVKSVAQLAAYSIADFVREKGLSREGCERLIAQAHAQVTGKITVRAPELLKALPPPATGDLFFDMESDPMAGEHGLEYLFGIWVREGKQESFKPFWALSEEKEKEALESTIDYFTAFAERHPAMKIYHYGSYEPSHLANLACRHGTREDELDQLLRDQRFIDLYGLVRRALILPVESLSLKVLEPLFAFHREGEVKAAASSIVFFEQWIETGDGALLDAIAAYNEMDVRSTACLYDWIRSLA